MLFTGSFRHGYYKERSRSFAPEDEDDDSLPSLLKINLNYQGKQMVYNMEGAEGKT